MASRITELDLAHLRHRGLADDVAWDYGEVCRVAGLTLREWRGTLSFMLRDATVLEFARRLLPAQRTGLLSAGLTRYGPAAGLQGATGTFVP